MNRCCSQPTAPRLFNVADYSSALPRPEGSPKQSAKLLEQSLRPVSPLPSRDFFGLLTNLRDRQEQLFGQVIDQQRAFEKQLVAIQSAIKASADASGVSNETHAKFMAELKDAIYSSHGAYSSHGEQGVTSEAEEKAAALPEASESPSGPTTDQDFSNAKHTGNGNGDNQVAGNGIHTHHGHTSPHHGHASPHHQDSGFQLKRNLGSRVEEEEEDLNHPYLDRARRGLQSKEFEIVIAAAILVNAFIMCWECQYTGLDVGFNLQYPGRNLQAKVIWKEAKSVFTFFDWFFGCMFLLEMIVKLVCFRSRYFYHGHLPEDGHHSHITDEGVDHQWKPPCWTSFITCLSGVQGWNLLDSVSVIAFLFDKVLSASVINPQMLRLLRLFRLGRLVRLLRFVESLDHLYVMTTAISGLSHVLAFAILLLTLMLLTCDLLLVQILQATYFEEVTAIELTPEELQKHHEMYAYFGTCTRCMLSMFEITLGNWPPIARLLAEEVSDWFILICLCHKLTIGFAVVGVITGCILQETFKVAQTDDIIMFRQKKMAKRIMIKKMRALFEALDVSGNGNLELHELDAIGNLPEIKTWLASMNIETDDLHMLFHLIDVDDDGAITLEELIARMPRIQGNARSIDVLAMQQQMWKDLQRKKKKVDKADAGPSPKMKSCFADFILDMQNR